jgi:hypothetical protein
VRFGWFSSPAEYHPTNLICANTFSRIHWPPPNGAAADSPLSPGLAYLATRAETSSTSGVEGGNMIDHRKIPRLSLPLQRNQDLVLCMVFRLIEALNGQKQVFVQVLLPFPCIQYGWTFVDCQIAKYNVVGLPIKKKR